MNPYYQWQFLGGMHDKAEAFECGGGTLQWSATQPGARSTPLPVKIESDSSSELFSHLVGRARRLCPIMNGTTNSVGHGVVPVAS